MLNRYSLMVGYNNTFIGMLPETLGKWVEYQDAQQEIDKLKQQLDTVTAERDRLRTLIAALPKVEGEVEIQSLISGGYSLTRMYIAGGKVIVDRITFPNREDAKVYADLLRERRTSEAGGGRVNTPKEQDTPRTLVRQYECGVADIHRLDPISFDRVLDDVSSLNDAQWAVIKAYRAVLDEGKVGRGG